MINVFHAFSGVDSQYMAEKRVWGLDNVNVVGTMEVDVDVIISCALIHQHDNFMKFYNIEWDDNQYQIAKDWLKHKNIGYDFEKNISKIDRMKKDKLKQLYIASVLTRNFGDISLANKTKLKNEIDIFTYSSPCQSFSIAGKQKGLSGVSGLLLECEKFIEINKPKILLLENVKNLVGKKFISDFNNWLCILDKLGYNSYWKVLNAKDYGVPQNRERVFCLSIRKDIDDNGYTFPNPFQLNKRLKDILDLNVDEKYYYKNEKASELMKVIVDKYNKKDVIPCGSTLNQPKELNVANCITARYDARIQNQRSIGVAIVEPTIMETRCDEGVRFFKDNVCGTIRTVQSGGDKIILEPQQNRIGGIFDDEKCKHQAGSIWDKEGLAPTLDTMQGGYRQPMILENTDKIIKIDIQQQVEVRVHDINPTELYDFLKSYKNKSNQQIADELGIPKTKVDHWFRNDDSFSIPTRDIWFKLKEVLNIDSDKWDKSIMEFEVRDGVYEKSGRVYHSDGISPTLTTQGEEKILIKNATKTGWTEANIRDGINLSYPNSKTRRGRVQNEISPTLMCNNSIGTITNDFKIRKLTPKECWKLMDFDEDAFDKVKDYISDSQLYKQAGNSIVVSCLEHIFKNLKEIL